MSIEPQSFHRSAASILAGLALCFIASPPLLAGDPFSEFFEQAGSAPADAAFSALIPSGGGTFIRQSAPSSTGVPNTSPALPINAGGDKELHYFEATLAPSGSYALAPDQPHRIYGDVVVDGYIGVGFKQSFGLRASSFLLRASAGATSSSLDAYVATLNHFNSNTANLSISRIANGIGQLAFKSSSTFSFDPTVENMRLAFSAVGNQLTASLWRVRVIEGAVVESPVDLDSTTVGIQSSIFATDGALSSGRVGLQAFLRGDNHIFFDEVLVEDLILQSDFFEDFDQSGSAPADAEFSELIVSGGGTFVREPADATKGLPNTVPPLPINAGGDKELHYYEATLAASGSYALVADRPDRVYENVTIDGYIGIGFNQSFGLRTGGFLVRASAATTRTSVNAYVATLRHFNNNNGNLSISRIANGIGQFSFVSSSTFAFDPSIENMRLSFSAVGDQLPAPRWRVRVVNGAVVEIPVDLDSATAGVQKSIVATDPALTSGRVGLRSFLRGDNHIYFDEIFVE